MSHAISSTTVVRIAVPRLESIPSIPINNTDTIFVPVIPSRRNTSESVFLIPHFANTAVIPAKKGRIYCIKYPHTSHLPKTSSFHNADKCIRLWIIHHVIYLFVAISQILEQGSFLVTLLCINIRGQFCEISIFITVKA